MVVTGSPLPLQLIQIRLSKRLLLNKDGMKWMRAEKQGDGAFTMRSTQCVLEMTGENFLPVSHRCCHFPELTR